MNTFKSRGCGYFQLLIIVFLDHICDEPVDTGPCFSALQYETQVEAAEGKSELCKSYLAELLNKCSWRNTTFSETDCPKNCSKYYMHLCICFFKDKEW